jgi:hypothetical protein
VPTSDATRLDLRTTSPAEVMQGLLFGAWISQAITVVAEFGCRGRARERAATDR